MNITIEFNTHNDADVKMLPRLGAFFEEAGIVYGPNQPEQPEQPSAVEEAPEQTEAVETPAEQTHIEEKPKRKRSPRKKVEEPVAVESPTEAEIEAATEKTEDSVQEADEEKHDEAVQEPEEVAAAEPEKEDDFCSLEDWRKILTEKYFQLGIYEPDGNSYKNGPHFLRRDAFLAFVHKLSEGYGDSVPSKLDKYQLKKFVSSFKHIVWDEDDRNFVLEPPF